MAHENREELYDDWDEITHCSFKNVFNSKIANIVGRNIHEILKITHFKTGEMAEQAPEIFRFTCSRRQANSIRDHLSDITTDQHSDVWFLIQNNPFHFINRLSMIETVPVKIKDYPVYFYFGSMRTHSTFNRYSEEHPSLHKISIMRWKDAPETLRIMSIDKSRQIFIPVKWIQRQILVNLKGRSSVVFMLKNSVKMKQQCRNDSEMKYNRLCKSGDEAALESVISKCSDLVLSFENDILAYTFIRDFVNENGDHKNKFSINFVTLKQTSKNNGHHPSSLPATATHKERYAFHMLYAMGYVFQDKYSSNFHKEFLLFAKDYSFMDMCSYLKEKLEENHCYKLSMFIRDYREYIKNKRREQDDQVSKKLHSYTIGCVSLTPLRLICQPMISSIGNRAIRIPELGGEDNFLLVHIREEDNKPLKDFDPSVRHRLKSKMAKGITLLGKTYRLFGTSTSQFKEMSFWFVDLQDQNLSDAWKLLGDFSGIKNVANYVARIGLFFSTAHQTNISFRYVDPIRPDMKFVVTEIPDEKTKNEEYCFTDGVGKMSWGIAALIAKRLNIPMQCQNDIPSAYQVRVAGCKGMLAIDPESQLNDMYIKIRPSMKKFKSPNWDLEICEWSRPLGLKFNNQVIMLLSELGNQDGVFESYLNASITNSAEQNELERNIKVKYASAKEDLLKNNFPLPLREGRNMFGLADETRTLKYGQVFIQYKNLDPKSNQEYIVVKGEVIIAKMPCLHPGDIRKFTAIDVPELRKCIRDCVVFPIQGPRPHPNELSGSDLDGDQYWVYWGSLLKIERMEDPLSYTPASRVEVPAISPDIVINHIVDSFGTGSQGIICNIHLAIAASPQYGVKSKECVFLAELFARAVDAPKTGEIIDLNAVYKLRAKIIRGYPQFMKKYDQPIVETRSVLNKLFLAGRRQFFKVHDPLSNTELVLDRASSPSLDAKVPRRLKPGMSPKDPDFQKWLDSLDEPVLINTAVSSPSVVDRPSTERKSSSSDDVTTNQIDGNTPESENEGCGKQTYSSESSEDEQKDDSNSIEPIIDKKRRTPDDVEPIDTKAKVQVTTPVAPASRDVITKPSLNSTTRTDNTLNRTIIFNGMAAISNRIKWDRCKDGLFTVHLDSKSSRESNAVKKFVQYILDSAKTRTLSKESKLTLVMSWGKLSLQIPQTIVNEKPKHIKELLILIQQNNDMKLLFNKSDVKSITKENEPSNKSLTEYVLVCQLPDSSSDHIALIFNDKKVLKRFSVSNQWCLGIARRDDNLLDSLYEIHVQDNEIDSNHQAFSHYLNTIFNEPDSTSILSGESPQLTIATEMLKRDIHVISLQRITCCSYDALQERKFGKIEFGTLKDLAYAFYHVTHISTEKINGKIPTNETIECHVKQIRIAKKHETDLNSLLSIVEEFFI